MLEGIRWVLLCLVGLAATTTTAAPVLTVRPELVEFGTVREGTIPEAIISVTNTGDAPGSIHRFQSSCPCVELPALSEPERVIAPGSSRDYTIRYNTEGYRGERGATLAITANDANSPHLLKVSITIETPLRVIPRSVHWARARRGAACEDSIVISGVDPGSAIELVKLESSQDSLLAHGEASISDGEPALKVSLALDETAPIGPMNAEVEATVRLDGAEHTVQIPVTVSVVGDFVYYPPSVVSVKPLMRGTRLSELTIVPSEESEVSVLDVGVTGPIQADTAETDPEGKRVIPIFIAPDAPVGPQAGLVTVLTSSSEMPLVRVPVYFEVLSPVTVEPETVVLREGVASSTVSLRSLGTDMEIWEPQSTVEGISATIVNGTERPDAPASVAVRLTTERSTIARGGAVVVRTNVKGLETVTVPVMIAPHTE